MWDARLTSELILLFLYLGYLALVAAIDDTRRADNAGALLAAVGAVNVPIIYFSVKWWNTLHQGASVSMMAAPKMATTMLQAMLLMTISFWAYAFAVVFTRTRAIVLEREARPSGCAICAQGVDIHELGLVPSAFLAMGGYGRLRLGRLRGDRCC